MTRTCGVLILVAVASASIVAGQEREPRFDVASVKPSGDPFAVPSGKLVGGRIEMRVVTAAQLIAYAYAHQNGPLARGQIVNGPSWIEQTKFDIEATSSETLDDKTGVLNTKGEAMLRGLLSDRFGLKAHFETREQSVYALQPARADRRLGPKLQRRGSECMGVLNPGEAPRRICNGNTGAGWMWAKGLSMNTLAGMLSNVRPEIDRYVVDRTDMTGLFDWELSWSADRSSTLPHDGQGLFPNSGGLSLFTALREQLGLKLEPTRESLPVLVVDSINQPTPN